MIPHTRSQDGGAPGAAVRVGTANPGAMAKILLIEADASLAHEFEVTLRVHDHDVVRLDSVAEALVRSFEIAPDLVLFDAATATEDETLLLDGCRYIAPDAGLVVIAKQTPDEVWRALLQQRCVSATLVRPFRVGALLGSLRWAARATSASAW